MIYFVIAGVAFISEYLDSGLGMGYGTALAPILILMGFNPLEVVPAVLISQLFTDIAACISHHRMFNVDLRPGSSDFKAASLLGVICFGCDQDPEMDPDGLYRVLGLCDGSVCSLYDEPAHEIFLEKIDGRQSPSVL